MKRLFVWLALLFVTVTAASADPYRLERSLRIPGAYFFTPALSSPRFALFGYIGKARPTPEEIAAERKRIRRILDSAVKREYGGWEKYGEAMKEAGKEAAARAASEEPAWARTLMPPSLIEEAVPLLMKGALMWAMAHPEAQTEPFGNVAETGIVLLDAEGRYTKIPLGIDQPVLSLDISPDGRYAVALCDMSVEDEKGRLHTAGRICLVDTETKKVRFERIYANACGEVRFSPDGRRLAFVLRDPAAWERMAIRFIDLRSGRLEKGAILFEGADVSESFYGRKRRLPHFRFAGGRLVALFSSREKGVLCFDARSLRRRGLLKGSGPRFAAAKSHPWIFDERGRLRRCGDGKGLFSLNLPRDTLHEIPEAVFFHGDRKLLAVDRMGCLYRVDTATRSYQKSECRPKNRSGLFFLTPDEKMAVAFRESPGGGFVRYGPLKRRKTELRIFETGSLRMVQTIRPPRSTVIDAAAAGNRLFVSDFERIDIYTKE